jgi:hypothetical protein
MTRVKSELDQGADGVMLARPCVEVAGSHFDTSHGSYTVALKVHLRLELEHADIYLPMDRLRAALQAIDLRYAPEKEVFFPAEKKTMRPKKEELARRIANLERALELKMSSLRGKSPKVPILGMGQTRLDAGQIYDRTEKSRQFCGVGISWIDLPQISGDRFVKTLIDAREVVRMIHELESLCDRL